MESPISRHEAELIQKSFHLVDTGSIALTERFYQILFNRKPELRSIFPNDLSRQKKKFLDTLNIIVNGCMVIHRLQHTIEDLGRVHKPFKATADDYEIVGDALIETLESYCAANWKDETAEAWRKVFNYMAKIMMSV